MICLVIANHAALGQANNLMHIHILGVCGTFMGGIAVLAKSLGHTVTGSDANVYPPMSTQLEQQGIGLMAGDDLAQLDPVPDMVIIGNALSRGHPVVEAVLNRNIPYCSGPEWLHRFLLQQRWVLGVAGTHGKTTTASMLAWILEYAGLKPGFLIGGVPQNFGVSARLGDTPFFVVEADEYDTAFFDKRSKFVHYHPRTLVMNNLEFDHADIFNSLDDIKRQFHHLVRTVPGHGKILSPYGDNAINDVLAQGCWSEQETIGDGGHWSARLEQPDGSQFTVLCHHQEAGQVHWGLMGQHNVHNALMALAAARHAGVAPDVGCEALSAFVNTRRRMELRGTVNNIAVYDDFAHHPTAITTTLQGLRAHVGQKRILAVLEPRSNTMRQGVMHAQLPAALSAADAVYLFEPAGLNWSLEEVANQCPQPASVYRDIDTLVEQLVQQAQPGDHILIMSNGGFGGIHERLLQRLADH